MLPTINFRSEEWETIEAYLNQKLINYRTQNEGAVLPRDEQVLLLGKIQILKELLNLPTSLRKARDSREVIS